MHKEKEGETERRWERKCDDARKQRQGCSYAEDVDRTRSWRKHRVREWERERAREGQGAGARRTKKERRRRRNADALSTWATRRKKKDAGGTREGPQGVTRLANALSFLSLPLCDFPLPFLPSLFNSSLRFLHPFTSISLAFHSSPSYLTVLHPPLPAPYTRHFFLYQPAL